jgi:hypothetical protein
MDSDPGTSKLILLWNWTTETSPMSNLYIWFRVKIQWSWSYWAIYFHNFSHCTIFAKFNDCHPICRSYTNLTIWIFAIIWLSAFVLHKSTREKEYNYGAGALFLLCPHRFYKKIWIVTWLKRV